MKDIVKTGDTRQIQDWAGKVAWGATGVALISAVVAVGALLLTDKRTRTKITEDTTEAVSNIRKLMDFLKKASEKATQTIDDIRTH
jgi:hypothetical protein